MITGGSAPHSGSEDTAQCYLSFVVRPADWLDLQLQDTDPGTFQVEGELDPFTMVSGKWNFNIWPTGYASDVQLLCPYFVWAGVINIKNDAMDGNPANDDPITIPNLFLRDYGRQEPSNPTGVLTSNNGPLLPVGRIMHRRFGLFQADSTSVGANQDVIHRVSFRTGRATIRRNQAFAIGFGAYNTHQTTNITYGVQFSGTFGYRRYQRI